MNMMGKFCFCNLSSEVVARFYRLNIQILKLIVFLTIILISPDYTAYSPPWVTLNVERAHHVDPLSARLPNDHRGL